MAGLTELATTGGGGTGREYRTLLAGRGIEVSDLLTRLADAGS